jgi:hypothetical protein
MTAHHHRRARSLDPRPADLYDYLALPHPRRGRPPKHDLKGWRVIDDWPRHVLVTTAELDVFEAWFGDLLNDLSDV